MMPISKVSNHVVNQVKQVLEEWNNTIGTCQEFEEME
jgi:hypothetical protein